MLPTGPELVHSVKHTQTSGLFKDSLPWQPFLLLLLSVDDTEFFQKRWKRERIETKVGQFPTRKKHLDDTGAGNVNGLSDSSPLLMGGGRIGADGSATVPAAGPPAKVRNASFIAGVIKA